MVYCLSRGVVVKCGMFWTPLDSGSGYSCGLGAASLLRASNVDSNKAEVKSFFTLFSSDEILSLIHI